MREAWEQRQRCEAEIDPEVHVDVARLGMSRTDLRATFEGLQHDRAVPAPDPTRESSKGSPEEVLERWWRPASGDLARVEYELWEGRVYRIRWRLGADFERPVLDELGRVARVCFGEPDYDQTFEAEPGSPAATLRRIGWTHGDRRIELRQLHPLRGGPVYLSVTDRAALREMGRAGQAPFSDPDQSGPWWQRPTRVPQPSGAEERARLGKRFLELLAQLDH